MTAYISTDGADPFADGLHLDLIADLADQAAQGALLTYELEDWHDSPFAGMLETAAATMRSAGRNPSPAIIEAQERFAAAQGSVT